MLTIDANLTLKISQLFDSSDKVFRDYLKEIQVPTGSCSSTEEVGDAISSITETINTARKIAELEIVPDPLQLFPDLKASHKK